MRSKELYRRLARLEAHYRPPASPVAVLYKGKDESDEELEARVEQASANHSQVIVVEFVKPSSHLVRS